MIKFQKFGKKISVTQTNVNDKFLNGCLFFQPVNLILVHIMKTQ